MRFPKFSKTDCAIVAVTATVLAALLFLPGVGVWDGDFPLTIEIDGNDDIDRDSLAFATFWFEADANEAAAQPELYASRFRPPKFTADGHALIHVPASGRIGNWLTAVTYNHAQHLLVTFRPAGVSDGRAQYKRFPIPTGRGARTMRIALPNGSTTSKPDSIRV